MTGGVSSAGIEAAIDAAPLGRFQVRLLIVCGAVAMIDGFDTQLIGIVAPEIARDWGAPAAAFGPAFGAGLFGGMLGGFLFGAACDRFGRRPSLIAAIAMFALLSLVTPLLPGLRALTLLRFLTGIGLGGAFPAIIALVSEAAPRALRTRVVGWMFCGFPLGAVVAGGVAALVLPVAGWRAMFLIGGGVPLLLLPFVWRAAPESLRFLGVRRDAGRFARALDRMKLGVPWNGTFDRVEQGPRASVLALFTQGRAAGTLLIWATLFLSLLMAYFLINWLPLIARGTGIGRTGSVIAVAALNLGTIAGTIGLSKWANARPGTAIASAYLLGAVAIVLIGRSGGSTAMLLATCFVAGVFATGAQICMIGAGATFYETGLRATGVGWSIGVARAGGVIGPVIGGVLIGWGMSAPALFALTGGISLAAALAAYVAGRVIAARHAMSHDAGTVLAAPPTH